MTPNQHQRIRADLKAYSDGELAPLAQFFVARHLRACPSCREELIQMQTLSTELRESDPETSDAPLSTELRAHILDNAPVTDALPEEEVFVRPRISPKKAIFAVATAAMLFFVVSTFTGSKIKNTFNKAADSMTTTTDEDTGSGAPLGILGGGGGAIAPTAIPGVASSAATDKVQSSNGTDSNGMFSDGHVQRRGDAAALRAVPGLAQQQDSVASAANPIGASDATDQASVVPATRAVHREGTLSVAVQNAESAGDDAASIVKNAGGFVANTSLETGTGQHRTAVLDCRVPVAQFETVVKKIGALGTVRAKSLSGQDITAQVAQSGARRQTLAQELSMAQTRLADKEKSRNPNAGDLYQLRAEVRTIRMQASQARAALETLQKYGALSSLYVSLQDGLPSTTPHAAGWFDSLSPTTQAAWTSFLSNARLPLQLLLWILAYSPLWLPALIIWHKYGRKWLTS